MLQEFIDWEQKIRPELMNVSEIMSERLSSEPEELIKQACEAEAWNYRMLALMAQADAFLDRYTLIVMPPKEDGKLEADRKAFVDAKTSEIRLVRDTLQGFVDSIRQRLILSESILSYMKIYAEKQQKHLEKIY